MSANCGFYSPLIMSDIRSAIIMVVQLVLARMQSGITDASMTRRFSRPLTRHCWSTTANGSSVRPHLAGAGDVLRRGNSAHQPVVQRFVRLQVGRSRLDNLLDDVGVVRVVYESHAQPHRLAHPGQVAGVIGEVVVVQLRLLVGVGGGDGQVALARRPAPGCR